MEKFMEEECIEHTKSSSGTEGSWAENSWRIGAY